MNCSANAVDFGIHEKGLVDDYASEGPFRWAYCWVSSAHCLAGLRNSPDTPGENPGPKDHVRCTLIS